MTIRYINNGTRFEINGKSFLTVLSNRALNPRLKRLIRDGRIGLPQGYVFSSTGKSIIKIDDEKITYKKLNKTNARNAGFKTAKELKTFYTLLKNENHKPKTFTELKQLHDTFINFKNITELDAPLPRQSKKRYFNVRTEKTNFTNQKIYDISPRGAYNDYTVLLQHLRSLLLGILPKALNRFGNSIKIQLDVNIQFFKFDANNNKITINDSLPNGREGDSPKQFSMTPTSMETVVDDYLSVIEGAIEKYTRRESGWIFEDCNGATLTVLQYTPDTGSAYFALDSYISLKKAVLNIKNTDEKCFFYALLKAVHPEIDHRYLNNFYAYIQRYDFDEKDCPIQLHAHTIKKYSKKVGCNISVYHYKNGSSQRARQMYFTGYEFDRTVDLLFVESEDGQNHHYCAIQSLSRLMTQGYTGNVRRKFICRNCQAGFVSEEKMANHIGLCKNNDTAETRMSQKDRLYFINHHRELKVPVVRYADFEAINKKSKNAKDCDKHVIITDHEPSGANILAVGIDGKERSYYETTNPKTCMEDFYSALIQGCLSDYKTMYKYSKFKKQILWKEGEERQHKLAPKCLRCDRQFASQEQVDEYAFENDSKIHPLRKCAHHCHFTGAFYFSCCNECNLKLRLNQVPIFPVFFHNYKGYDSNFTIKFFKQDINLKIMKRLLQLKDITNVVLEESIPITSKKFMSVSLVVYGKKSKFDKTTQTYVECDDCQLFKIRFLDSMCFLDGSLDTLARELNDDDKQLLRNIYKSDDDYDLMKQKGSFFFEYTDSIEKLMDNYVPPPWQWCNKIQHFDSQFDELSVEEKVDLWDRYNHTIAIKKRFGCKNNFESQNIYMKNDTYLLACIFERFRQISLEKFKLDPCHYYTLPSLAWDAMLKVTGCQLQLFQEDLRDMYLELENAKIGGISTVGSKYYAQSNHRHLKSFVPNNPKTHIVYSDANGLYATAMSMKLPYGDFTYVPVSEFNLKKAFDEIDGDYGYFVKVNARLPKQFHDAQNDYPCFPENIAIHPSQLSPSTKKDYEILNMPFSSESKLIPNLWPKKEYLVHIRTLKLWVELGWEVDVVKVIQFRQSAWCKPFIDLCISQRQKASSDFEKLFWKLCCNAVYGKFLENVRNRVNIKFFHPNDEDKYQKSIDSFRFRRTEKISEDLMMVNMGKHSVQLNKPVYAGIAILNLSKWIMYDLFYNVLRKKYPDCKMLYTDTDSFILEIPTDDFYADLINDEEFRYHWDLSNYSNKHFMWDGLSEEEINKIKKKNKKVLGKLKDEMGGIPITEFVALRAKMYSVIDEEGSERKFTGKGIHKKLLKSYRHEAYRDCLFKKTIHSGDSYHIQSDKYFNLNTVRLTKTTLSPLDDKRYKLEDGFSSLAYGYSSLSDH